MKALLDSGVELEGALVDARTKDASVDPATVAWVLEQVSIQPSAPIPGGMDAIELDQFRKQLVQRLRKAAFDLVK